ncbi:MAG TPA: type II toxin-antitoxin system VapC family toxin, partial [Nitrososphaerales archaeon]|nr:type II toxin-antitoxin system VapC family toxin [Nitrososphaerales archaeon]
DLKGGLNYISLLLKMVYSGLIVLIRPDANLMRRAYDIAGKKRIPIYDASFLALARETGLNLKSLDQKTTKIFKSL